MAKEDLSLAVDKDCTPIMVHHHCGCEDQLHEGTIAAFVPHSTVHWLGAVCFRLFVRGHVNSGRFSIGEMRHRAVGPMVHQTA